MCGGCNAPVLLRPRLPPPRLSSREARDEAPPRFGSRVRPARGAPREARGGARSRRHPARRGRAHVEARSTAAIRDRGRRTRSRSSRAGGRRARGALHSTWPETGRRAPWGAAPRCGSRARGPRGWVPPRIAQWSSSPPSQGCRVSCSRRRVSRSARRMRSTGSREYIRRVSASPETRGTNSTVVVERPAPFLAHGI